MEAAIIIASLLFSSFFSGMGVALSASNKVYLGVEGQQQNFFSSILRRVTENPQAFNTAMIIGNWAAVVVYICFSATAVENWLVPYNLSAYARYFIEIAVPGTVLLITAVFLPRVFFRIYANTLVRALALPAYIFYILLLPFTAASERLSVFVLKYFFRSGEVSARAVARRTDLDDYISVPQLQADESADAEIAIFRNAMLFTGRRAENILTPRSEIAAVALSDDMATLRRMFIATGYSKIMVYEGVPENITGYVHSFSLFGNPGHISDIMIEAEEARAGTLIKDVLDALTRKRKSVAVIKNDNDEMLGIITVEDIIEELFGEIEDEHDEDHPLQLQLENGAYAFSAQLEVAYVNQTYGLALPESDAYRTLGGLVVYVAGNALYKGSVFTLQDNIITVTAAEDKIINTIEIKPLFSKKN